MSIQNPHERVEVLRIVSNEPAAARFDSVGNEPEVDFGPKVEDGTRVLGPIARFIERIARKQRPAVPWPRRAVSARLKPTAWAMELRVPDALTGPELVAIVRGFGRAVMAPGYAPQVLAEESGLLNQAADDELAACAEKLLASPVARCGPLRAHIDCSFQLCGREILRLRGSLRAPREQGRLEPQDEAQLATLEGYSEADHSISVYIGGDMTRAPTKIFCADDAALQQIVDDARKHGMLRYAYTRTMPNGKEHLALRYAERV